MSTLLPSSQQYTPADTDFDTCFNLLIGVEGGFTDDPKDHGNWTSGVIGIGESRGSKYGISAASYPNIAIALLTPDEARAIYRRDFGIKPIFRKYLQNYVARPKRSLV